MAKVYIAVPYSQDKERGFETACRAAAALLKAGNVVYSPIALSHHVDRYLHGAPWELWKRQDFAMIDLCDVVAVVTLPGWEKSTGVTDEIRHAEERGLPVLYLPESFAMDLNP